MLKNAIAQHCIKKAEKTSLEANNAEWFQSLVGLNFYQKKLCLANNNVFGFYN